MFWSSFESGFGKYLNFVTISVCVVHMQTSSTLSILQQREQFRRTHLCAQKFFIILTKCYLLGIKIKKTVYERSQRFGYFRRPFDVKRTVRRISTPTNARRHLIESKTSYKCKSLYRRCAASNGVYTKRHIASNSRCKPTCSVRTLTWLGFGSHLHRLDSSVHFAAPYT